LTVDTKQYNTQYTHMQSSDQGSTESAMSYSDALFRHQQEQIMKLQKLQQEMSQQNNLKAPSVSPISSSNEITTDVNVPQPLNQKAVSNSPPNAPGSESNPPFSSNSGQSDHQPRVSFRAGVRAPAPIGPLSSASAGSVMQQLSSNGFMPSLGKSHSQTDRLSVTSESGVGDVDSSEEKWQTDSDLPYRREFIRLIAQLLTERKHNPSQKWLLELPYKARKLEEQLYRTAPSFEYYIDRSTLKQRLKKVATAITFRFRDAKRKSLTRRSSSITGSISDWSISSESPPPQPLDGGEAQLSLSSLPDANPNDAQTAVESTSDELQRTQALSQSLQEKIMANIAAQRQLMMSLGIGGPIGSQRQHETIDKHGNDQGFASSQMFSAKSSYGQNQLAPFPSMGDNDNSSSTTEPGNTMNDSLTNATNVSVLTLQQQGIHEGSSNPGGQQLSGTQQEGDHVPGHKNGDENPPMTPETFGW